MTVIRQSVKCPYCDKTAYQLYGKDGEPKIQGWTRYGCENEHKFALPPGHKANSERT